MRAVRRHQSLQIKKAKQAVLRLWPLGDKMMTLAHDICEKESNFRVFRDVEKQHLMRWAKKKALQSQVFFVLGSESDLKFSAEALDDRSRAFARIPTDRLMSVRKLPSELRLQAMADLIEEYGKSGNGCGHNPAHFQCDGVSSPYDSGDHKDPMTGSQRKPQIVYETIDRLIYAIIHPSEYKHLFYQRVAYHVKRYRENWRQIRTEGRESMLGVLKVLLLDWNPRSMRAGHYKDGEFLGISIATLSKWSGLSKSRVKTGLRLLEKQDFLFSGKQRREFDNETGKWRGLPVLRVFKPTLFAHLNLDTRMVKERIDPDMRRAEQRSEALQAASACGSTRTVEEIRAEQANSVAAPKGFLDALSILD